MKVTLAQLDPVVGDVSGNTRIALAAAERARDEQGARLIIFPEMFLCGYPPEDLLFHSGLRRQIEAAIERLRQDVRGIAFLMGYPEYDESRIYNSAIVYDDGRELARYRKWLLPNYQVFDEKRYFTPGDEPCVFSLDGVSCGINVCEDIWEPGPPAAAARAGADVLFAINGSPYSLGSQSRREAAAARRAAETGIPIVYVNMVGGQDELVFDGGSFIVGGDGEMLPRAVPFEELLMPLTIEAGDTGCTLSHDTGVAPLPTVEASVYSALVTGTRDYVRKNGFPGIILGLSGGIDSALTLAVAVDALGADNVRTVMMPYRWTSEMSRTDAEAQAQRLGVQYDIISIEPIVDAALGQLGPLFAGLPEDTTEENIQSRVRCLLLMAISNKSGRMLLTTGNKSEMAVGYATLYGDMAGGFAPLKDCSKSMVFRLARYRNEMSESGDVIPERVITRPPSAELRPDQKDTDSLPPYEVLDPILSAFIEEDLSVDDICARGFERETVARVLTLVRRNEYKRRQAPPGVRVSRRAFGRDWRYPITSGYRFPE